MTPPLLLVHFLEEKEKENKLILLMRKVSCAPRKHARAGSIEKAARAEFKQ
jgi:hypothetical protein